MQQSKKLSGFCITTKYPTDTNKPKKYQYNMISENPTKTMDSNKTELKKVPVQ